MGRDLRGLRNGDALMATALEAAAELADAAEQWLDKPSPENRDQIEEAVGRYREATRGS